MISEIINKNKPLHAMFRIDSIDFEVISFATVSRSWSVAFSARRQIGIVLKSTVLFFVKLVVDKKHLSIGIIYNINTHAS
jgi:hypothetical protein